MRKTSRHIMAAALALFMMLGCLSGFASAAGSSGISVTVPRGVESRAVTFRDDTGYPYMGGDGQVMVPLRAAGEALGFEVTWDGASRSAVFIKRLGLGAPAVTVTFTVDAKTYTVTTDAGTETKTMETALVMQDGRVYAPIAYLAECLGYEMSWDSASQTVAVSTGWDEKTRGYMELYFNEVEQARYITNRPHAYEENSFNAYYDMFEGIYWMMLSNEAVITDETIGMVYGLKDLREKLVQTAADPESTIWYIWGEDMPEAADAADYDYTYTWDNADFKPFLVPYLLDDQSQVKGNIIVIAGGGFWLRSNSYEGYAIAERFNDLGYNTFVLQRRVDPSQPVDAFLDLQRSVRYIRYHADELGIEKSDLIAACGFSGGGMTINGAVEQFYGNVLPTTVYPDYQCDAVDQVNSDLSTSLLIYGAGALDTENPNLPDTFIAIGEKDATVSLESQLDAVNFYESRNVRYEFHIMADAPHGFGADWGLNGATFQKESFTAAGAWPELADTFMSIQYGYLPASAPYEG